MATGEPKKRRRDYGDDGVSWDKINKVYVGTISPGLGSDGKRDRRTARAKTKTEVKNRLDALHDEINAGIRTRRRRARSRCASPTGSTRSSATRRR